MKSFTITFYSFIIVFLLGNFTSVCQTSQKKLYLNIEDSLNIKKTQNQTFNNYNELSNHLSSTISELQEQGYLAAYHTTPKKINDSTFTTTIFKNSETPFIYVKNYTKLPKIVQDQFSLPKGDKNISIPTKELSQKLKQLNQILSQEGNPFNSIQLKDIYKKEDSLFANIEITKLNPRVLDSIVIKGYPKFPRGFLKYYSGLKKGTVYKNSKIETQSQQINNLSFVTSSKSAEVLFNPKSTQLYLYLKKQNANNFDGFIGFSTEEDSGDVILDGYLNLNLINNLNFGEEVNLTYKSDTDKQQQFSFHTKLPYIFNLPLGLEASLSIFRQEDEFSSTEQSIGFNYALTPRIETFLGYKKYESADLNEDENIVSLNTNYDSQFIESKIKYTHRQNSLLFPNKITLTLGAEIGSRNINNTKQYKLNLIVKHIFNLNQRNSIFIGNTSQYFESDDFLANELYRFGGILSIRGFEENSLRANILNVLNTEYRYQLSTSIYAHSIVDFAYINNQLLNSEDQLTSIGVGIGMLTRAGLFKLNYANGRSQDIPFEFGNSKIHLSLTAYF